MPTSDADCRAAKLCAGAVPRPWLLRNRMSELFTYGSVGGAPFNGAGDYFIRSYAWTMA